MIFEAKNLEFKYEENSPLIKNFSLKIESGEFFMLSGPNGSGKSTILKLLSGFLTPANGEIRVNSDLLQKFSYAHRASMIAVVSQNQVPILDFTVAELIMTGRSGSLNRFVSPSKKDCEICQELIVKLELEKFKNRAVNQLSGGERARVFLAKALAQNPQILLLDEPTAALDLEYTFKVLDLLKALSKKIAIIMVCHDLNLAWKYADKLYILNHGETAFCGNPREILTPENIRQIYHCNSEIISDKGIIF